MKGARRLLTISVSGPDGAGKSTLVNGIVPALRDRGFHTVTAYCYGCVACRRFPSPARARATMVQRRRRFVQITNSLTLAHSVIDASELGLRLAAARLRARMTARGRPCVVVTDRGPLDGLVKFDPDPNSRAAALFARLSSTYDTTLLLDAAPETLTARDGEHTINQLAYDRAQYRRWARRVTSVVKVDSAPRGQVVVASALASILRGPAGATPRARHLDPAPSPKRVVISIFDNPHNSHYGGGGAIVVDKVARRLSEDFRTIVITASRRGGTRLQDGVLYRYLPIGWAGPRGGQLLFHALLPLVARAFRHDLWIESFTPPFSTSFVPLFSRAPVIGVGQQLCGKAMCDRYHLPFWIVERLGLRLYRNVVAINEADRELIQRHSPATAVHLIPNGVDRHRADEADLGDGEHILFLGRIELAAKGLDLLLAGYERASPALPLLIAGAGTREQERRMTAMLARVDGEVRWVGYVDGARKQELLERSAFLVMPSRSESFGIAALEGMSYAKPVLHFDLPSLRWMRGGGVAVPAFDVDELARQMRELAADTELRRRLGGQAYQTAQRYSWEQTTGRYLSLARDLLGVAVSEAEGAASCGAMP